MYTALPADPRMVCLAGFLLFIVSTRPAVRGGFAPGHSSLVETRLKIHFQLEYSPLLFMLLLPNMPVMEYGPYGVGELKHHHGQRNCP